MNKLEKISLCALVAGTVGIGIYDSIIHRKPPSERVALWEKALARSDELGDCDGLISSEEFGSIYSALGLEDRGIYAVDLNVEQLSKYLGEN